MNELPSLKCRRSASPKSKIGAFLLSLILFGALPVLSIETGRESARGDFCLQNADASFIGENEGAVSGASVAITGDNNGDGYDDILIGAPGWNNIRGQAYQVLGNSSGWAMDVNLSNSQSTFFAVSDNAHLGNAVSGVGDVNGDGYEDFVIGSFYDCRVYLFFGNPSGWPAKSSCYAANASFVGEEAWSGTGSSVAGVGDVNGDGLDDLFIGSPYYQNCLGKAYLIFGKESGWKKNMSLSAAPASFIGEEEYAYMGWQVASAGDVNGDGFDDLLIGAPYIDDPQSGPGKVYLVFGKAGGWSTNINLSQADASFIGESAGDWAGYSISGAGDVNGDGYDDILIGAPHHSDFAYQFAGKAYLFFGKSSGWARDLNLSSADVSFVGPSVFPGMYPVLGWAVAGGGDVNGDEYDDMLIAAPVDASIGIGEVHLVLGKKEDWSKRIELGPDSGPEEIRFLGETINDLCGRSISCCGDANGDGFDDILIGAPQNCENCPYSGQTYLVFPYRNSLPTSMISMKIFSDPDFQNETSFGIRNDTLYVEMQGSDGNPSTTDISRVNITCTGSKRALGIRLRETGPNTGVYRGNFTLMDRNHEGTRWMKASEGDKVMISPFGRPGNVTQITVGKVRVRSPSAGELVATEDASYLLNLTAENATSTSWTYKTNASWLELNASVPQLTGMPDNSEVGSFWVVVNGTDQFGRSNELNFTITVNNTAPGILTADQTTALEDLQYRVDYDSSDDGQGNISWSLLAETAPWLSINTATGVLDGLPGNDDVGEHAIRVSVTDGNGGLDWTSFMLNVINVNDKPVIITGDITLATEDVRYEVDYEATDPDVSDILFQWSVETTAGWLSMNGSTGVLSGIPSNSDVGNCTVNVTVRDLAGATSYHEFTLQVQNVNDPPVWKDVPSDATIVEGNTYIFDVNATDVDIGDTLTYGLKTEPATDAVIGAGSGIIAWTPDKAEVYIFNVSAGDGWLIIFHEFVMTVERGWSPSKVRLLEPANGSLVNNTNVTLTVDGDYGAMDAVPLNISLYLGLDSDKVEAKDSSVMLSATLRISPAFQRASRIVQGPLVPNATYYWTAVPSDGSSDGICENGVFSFTVINHPPTLMPPTDQRVKAGKAFRCQLQAGDADVGDEANLTFALEQAPSGMTIDARTGLIAWTPGNDDAGEYPVRAVVSDGHGGKAGQDFVVKVEEHKMTAPTAANVQIMLGGAVLVIAFAVGAVALLARRRKEGTGPTLPMEHTGKEQASGAEVGATPVRRAVVEAPPAATTPTVPALAPAGTAPAVFSVDDVFLMYRDGRLIQHTTRRFKPDMDFDIMTSMLKAVQDFVKESIGLEEGAELGSMEYGENKILFEKGRHTILACVITGKEPDGFRDEMKSAIKNIQSEFASVLPEWDGASNKLAGAKKFLAALGSFAPAQVVADQKVKGDVSLKAELEFYQGFVRLKVAVKNSMSTTITDAYFRLIYNQEVLRLDQTEPEFGRRGDEVQIGNIQPNEKRTIAFYLDPQICTESYLEGVLTFKDAHGNLETVKMPKKLTSVVCPILFTEENINTAMLKRMAVDELPQKDTKVFAIPPTTLPDKAFEIAKAAVQHHDVRLVREFMEKEPYVGEVWYYGKAKGREDKIVIRARVISAKNVLEFFVASTSTLMLTGMLAELKTDLNKELDSRNVRTGMRQVTSQKEVDALGAIKTLLERASEAESGDSEIDIRRK
jgi:hypothetical protein